MIESQEIRSFEAVNYLLRPKKQIERKIIIEIMQELNPEVKLSKYLYVGFGSIYYYDFILFHKILRMNKLLSIDNKSTRKRFEFNRPYDFISFKNQLSTDYLSEFAWDQNVVLWLDYDKRLNDIVLADLKLIAKNCRSRDILIITVNSSSPKDLKRRKEMRYKFYGDFRKYISSVYTHPKYFTPELFANLLQNVILNYMETVCEYRDLKFYKLFSFRYQDTSPMFTVGGVFDKTDELSGKDWNSNFIRTNQEIINIDVPILTYYEKFWIDSHIEEIKKDIRKVEDKIKEKTTILSGREKEQKMTELINDKLPFELPSFRVLKKYLDFYRFFPQYYEGVI